MKGLPTLSWSYDQEAGDRLTWNLDPDHPAHADNMARLTRMQRAVLRAQLAENLRALDATDPDRTETPA